jgi:putative ABC transport system ATP-binding protein
MKIIKVNSLVKIYDEKGQNPVKAVNEISLTFEEGEFTAVVGPSGSGKTTLLNMIGGLDQPTSGEILIQGIDIWKLNSSALTDFRLHNIGFIFQSYNLIPVLSARENVEFILQLQGKSGKEREQRSFELLEAVGLTEKRDSRPAKLSGGQQQRVAVARALSSRPKFILADEPTANLDSKSAENLLEIMEKLNKEEKITFIFSTHDPRVMNKARRVILLEDGKITREEIR